MCVCVLNQSNRISQYWPNRDLCLPALNTGPEGSSPCQLRVMALTPCGLKKSRSWEEPSLGGLTAWGCTRALSWTRCFTSVSYLYSVSSSVKPPPGAVGRIWHLTADKALAQPSSQGASVLVRPAVCPCQHFPPTAASLMHKSKQLVCAHSNPPKEKVATVTI